MVYFLKFIIMYLVYILGAAFTMSSTILPRKCIIAWYFLCLNLVWAKALGISIVMTSYSLWASMVAVSITDSSYAVDEVASTLLIVPCYLFSPTTKRSLTLKSRFSLRNRCESSDFYHYSLLSYLELIGSNVSLGCI